MAAWHRGTTAMADGPMGAHRRDGRSSGTPPGRGRSRPAAPHPPRAPCRHKFKRQTNNIRTEILIGVSGRGGWRPGAAARPTSGSVPTLPASGAAETAETKRRGEEAAARQPADSAWPHRGTAYPSGPVRRRVHTQGNRLDRGSDLCPPIAGTARSLVRPGDGETVLPANRKGKRQGQGATRSPA